MKEIDYSIVIPVYKSLDSLEPLFNGIKETMESRSLSFEVVFVEDGGSEESWKELLRLKGLCPKLITLIRLSRNFGQNGATLCGIDEAKGKRLITIDDDLQIHPKEILCLIDHMNQSKADVVYGRFPQEKSKWIRKWASGLVKKLFERSQGKKSIGSSFRLIEKHIFDRIKFHSQDHLFINQVISWYTLNFEFVDIEHNSRNEGKSGYSWIGLIGLSLKLIFYYTSLPLILMIIISIFGAFGLILMVIYYLYYQFETGRPIDLFLLSVLVSMVVISGSISVFGVYINRIYSARVKKPNYSIKVKL